MKVRLQRTLSCSGDAKCQMVQTQRYPREVLFALGGWHDGAPTNHMEVYGKRKHGSARDRDRVPENFLSPIPDFSNLSPGLGPESRIF